MLPSLPIELPEDTRLIRSTIPFGCAMLRFDKPCCNDAFVVLLCPQIGEVEEHRPIPVCDMCIDESGGLKWVTATVRVVCGI